MKGCKSGEEEGKEKGGEEGGVIRQFSPGKLLRILNYSVMKKMRDFHTCSILKGAEGLCSNSPENSLRDGQKWGS